MIEDYDPYSLSHVHSWKFRIRCFMIEDYDLGSLFIVARACKEISEFGELKL
jgi:hypothetical protein